MKTSQEELETFRFSQKVLEDSNASLKYRYEESVNDAEEAHSKNQRT